LELMKSPASPPAKMRPACAEDRIVLTIPEVPVPETDQELPPSPLRYTPASVPAQRVDAAPGSSASDQIVRPARPVPDAAQVIPPSVDA
jgi:hypothetical protein